jgi:ferritin
MDISENVKSLIQKQITMEFAGALMYTGFANWCEIKALKGFGKFFRTHAEEELKHANKFIDYLNDRGAFFPPQTIEPPFTGFAGKGCVDFVIASMKQENAVTESICTMVKAAEDDQDYISKEFLNWFLSEQKEEENVFGDVLARCKLVGKDMAAFLSIDTDLLKDGNAVGTESLSAALSTEAKGLHVNTVGITLKGMKDKLKDIIPATDKEMKVKSFIPLTSEIIDKYGTNNKFIKALNTNLSTITNGLYVPILSESINVAKKINNFLNRSSDFEKLDNRYFFVKRDHKQIIQKVYALYTDITKLKEGKPAKFKKIIVLYQ